MKLIPGEITTDDKHYCSYDCQNGSKDSLALIASDGERAYIINYVGMHLDYWICEGGANDFFEGVEAGVWFWKGRIKSSRDYFGEYDEELEGDFRKLTEEEWELLQGGDDLWDADEWNICPEKDKL